MREITRTAGWSLDGRDRWPEYAHPILWRHDEPTELPICQLCKKPLLDVTWISEVCPMRVLETYAKNLEQAVEVIRGT